MIRIIKQYILKVRFKLRKSTRKSLLTHRDLSEDQSSRSRQRRVFYPCFYRTSHLRLYNAAFSSGETEWRTRSRISEETESALGFHGDDLDKRYLCVLLVASCRLVDGREQMVQPDELVLRKDPVQKFPDEARRQNLRRSKRPWAFLNTILRDKMVLCVFCFHCDRIFPMSSYTAIC